MAKLTKAQVSAHEKACKLIESDHRLNDDEVLFVLDNWHEGAAHTNTRASAHFTPYELARHAALEVAGPRVLDLCAGIGTLSVAVKMMSGYAPVELTLVEINPDYAAVARRLLPDAEVIVGSMYDRDLMNELASRKFDTCISNPPFGSFSRSASDRAPRYKGADAHYDCIDIASDLADAGVFILPQTAVPFVYSGRQGFRRNEPGQNPRYDKFVNQTGIELGANIGIDTSVLPGFRDVGIVTEISTVDFVEARARRVTENMPLFGTLAA